MGMQAAHDGHAPAKEDARANTLNCNGASPLGHWLSLPWIDPTQVVKEYTLWCPIFFIQ
jgi:hypothetical protein